MKILIIGAGLSGRGFIPQFLDKKDKNYKKKFLTFAFYCINLKKKSI